jgi:hypothetical protein
MCAVSLARDEWDEGEEGNAGRKEGEDEEGNNG